MTTNVNQRLIAAAQALAEEAHKHMIGGRGDLIDDVAFAIRDAKEEADIDAQWRRLALQFDGHRMQALGHLRCLLDNPEAHAEAVRAFLAAPPLDGEQVLADRLAAMTQQVDPAVAAIQFALETDSDGLNFLRLWNDGEFDLLREEWPEAPEDIYIGADPLLEAAEPVAQPCWSCSKPVTMDQRAAADGNCPHCAAELDLEDWPAAKQQAEPVARDVIAKLVALTSAVNIAMDDSEERDGADGREHVIDSANFDAVSNALDALEELPDNKPGWAMNAADKAAWALRHLTDATKLPAVAVPDDTAILTHFQSGKDHGAHLYSDQGEVVYQLTQAELLHAARAMLAAAPQAALLSTALADIAAERRRQIEQEGWTPEHDDQHKHGALAAAAACYATCGNTPSLYELRHRELMVWPWDMEWWKPKDYRRNLVKAGALIAAEIERIDRATRKGGAA